MTVLRMSVWNDSMMECSFGGQPRRADQNIFVKELEESTSTDKVKRLRQVYEGEEERPILLLVLLLQLYHEDHFDGGCAFSEPALGLGVHARCQDL